MKHLFACALLSALVATSASAHVVFDEPEARANSYYAGFLRVSHGCGDSPTVALRVEIPAGINTARPQPKPGWTIEIEREPLAAPIRSEYGEITERVRAVTWRGRLEADHFDQFGLMLRLPDQAGPLYFRAIQTCESGERRWIDIPASGQAWHAVESPAPVLTVTRPEAAHAHH